MTPREHLDVLRAALDERDVASIVADDATPVLWVPYPHSRSARETVHVSGACYLWDEVQWPNGEPHELARSIVRRLRARRPRF